MRSVMAVIAECTLAVGHSLDATAAEIRSFNTAAANASSATGALSEQLVLLNRRLVRGTWVIGGATIVAALAAVASAVFAWS